MKDLHSCVSNIKKLEELHQKVEDLRKHEKNPHYYSFI